MGETGKGSLRMGFDGSLKLKFHGAKVTSDAGLLPYREAEVAVPRWFFRAILEPIRRLRPRGPVPG